MLQVGKPTSPYDTLPYPKYPHYSTHPRHLESLATLLGMKPAPIRSCRVLELGCAAGFNLIPQAIDLIESHFLGVDLSLRQILEGQQTIATLGLKNIELRQADILDIDETWGQFDYILCHGVFSWVPPHVQGRILDICKRNLLPHGVALVSYNTYPGWHLKRMVRELMIHHTAQFSAPRERIDQSMSLLGFLAETCEANHAFGRVIREELEALQQSRDEAYLFHEYLEPCNVPMYFHEFMGEATARGLQYLTDADVSTMLLRDLPERAQAALKDFPLLQQEQYMDFVRGRKFRATLLCHQGVPLERQIPIDRIKECSIGLMADPKVDHLDVRSHSRARLEFKHGCLEITHPVAKAAVMYLKERFPAYVSFQELFRVASERIAAACPKEVSDPEAGAPILALMLFTGYTHRMLELCLTPPRCVSQAGGRLLANPLARLQAAESGRVTNQRHQMACINDLARHVLCRLDGKHDRESLAKGLKEAIASGKVVVEVNNKPLKTVDTGILGSLVNQSLQQLSTSALLME